MPFDSVLRLLLCYSPGLSRVGQFRQRPYGPRCLKYLLSDPSKKMPADPCISGPEGTRVCDLWTLRQVCLTDSCKILDFEIKLLF